MGKNLFQVFLVEHCLQLAAGVTLVAPFLEDFVGDHEGIVHRHETHGAIDCPVVFHLHAFRFLHFGVGHVALDMAGANILDLVDAHITHDQVLVAHFGIAEAFVAGAEQNVAALGTDDGVDVFHVAAAHETVGAGLVVGFIEESYLIVAILGIIVFSIFNFRPKGKAKCFAGDVGSIGIAFIILFALGRLMLATGDITWIVLFLVYGVDGTLTICHRIMLHENLGQAHRKHAYQLMANELKIGHVKVSLLYMALQLVISLGFIILCPNTVLAHWIFLIGATVLLAVCYVLFMKKYYHLHEEYLASLN